MYTPQLTTTRASGLSSNFKGSQATAMRFIGAVIESATIKAPFSWSFKQLRTNEIKKVEFMNGLPYELEVVNLLTHIFHHLWLI